MKHRLVQVRGGIGVLAVVSLLAGGGFHCSGGSADGPGTDEPGAADKGVPGRMDPTVDSDGDGVPDASEDRNQNGVVDAGETDPGAQDSDGDGVPDAEEVAAAVCAVQSDRPYAVLDVPGARSLLLVDPRVDELSVLRDANGRTPGAMLGASGSGVAAVLVSADAVSGGPEAQRERARRQVLEALGSVVVERTRAFVTPRGARAEQTVFALRPSQARSAAAIAGEMARGLTGGAPLDGVLSPGGAGDRAATVSLLTVVRGDGRVVFLAAVAAGSIDDEAYVRMEELTDGTNLAPRDAFTRHVCDAFETEAKSAADILWVVDDSGSMADDQAAVRDAAQAMASILRAADVDFRLAVTRTRAREPGALDRGVLGTLEGGGFTRDISTFERDILVGAGGGWEPGLETGVQALERLVPRTPVGRDDPRKLRTDAATIVIHMSDERDQTVECAACGGCERSEGSQDFCDGGEAEIDAFVRRYQSFDAVTFAIVGDLPNGCDQGAGKDDFEPGQGYVEVANATGGQFGSLCGDMNQNLENVARAANGVASSYALSAQPASATLKVAIGQAGGARRVLSRSRTDGFDYDAAQNKIIFYGASAPRAGEEIVVAYRRWDYAGNPDRPTPAPDAPTPDEGCDRCPGDTSCRPDSDFVECQVGCGDQICTGTDVCLEDFGVCGDPGASGPEDACSGTCAPGRICTGDGRCVVPCEETGCASGQVCDARTHLCTDFDV